VLGRFKGGFSKIVHSIIAFALFGCLFIISLVIWGATDADVVFRTVATMAIIAVISVLGWLLTLLLEWVNTRNQPQPNGLKSLLANQHTNDAVL
jgi:hypothetical protein